MKDVKRRFIGGAVYQLDFQCICQFSIVDYLVSVSSFR